MLFILTGEFSQLLVRPKLLKAVQRAKHVLSVAHMAKIEVEHDGKEFNWELTRAKFEELTKDLSQRTMDYVGAVLKVPMNEPRPISNSFFVEIQFLGCKSDSGSNP